MDSVDDTSIISLYIKRFREQPPSSTEQRKTLIDQNTKRKFWWQSEDKEDLKTSITTAISELSLSRIIEQESSVKDSQFSIEFLDNSQLNLDEYTNKLLNKCDKLLEEYRIESITSIDNESNNSQFKHDTVSSASSSSSASSYVDVSHSSNSSIRSLYNSTKNEVQVNYDVTESSNKLEYDNSHAMSSQSCFNNLNTNNFINEQTIALELSKNESIIALPSQLMIKSHKSNSLILDLPKLHLVEYNDNINNSTSMYLSPPYSKSGQSPQNSIEEKDLMSEKIFNDSQTISIDNAIKCNVNNQVVVGFDEYKSNTRFPVLKDNDDSVVFSNESSLYGIEITNNNEDDELVCDIMESYIEKQAHIDLELISPYLGDEVIYYMWTRLCTIRNQIAAATLEERY